MSTSSRLLDVFEGGRRQRLILAVGVFLFLAVEIIIYASAASQAGDKARIVITDSSGAKVYETTGTVLTSYERMNFENNFGPLRNFQMNLQTESTPFPFRAWVSAAIGIPVGLVLLVSFVVKVYMSLLYGEDGKGDTPRGEAADSGMKGRMSAFSGFLKGLSVFHIGVIAFLAVLVLWMIPNFIGDATQTVMNAIREYPLFFIGAAVFLAALLVWMIYLRYSLSKMMIENQFKLEKIRIEAQLPPPGASPVLLAGPVPDSKEQHLEQTSS